MLSEYKANSSITLCNQNACLKATGENARLIVGAICFGVICAGIAAVIKSIK